VPDTAPPGLASPHRPADGFRTDRRPPGVTRARAVGESTARQAKKKPNPVTADWSCAARLTVGSGAILPL